MGFQSLEQLGCSSFTLILAVLLEVKVPGVRLAQADPSYHRARSQQSRGKKEQTPYFQRQQQENQCFLLETLAVYCEI
jgi:hypothetical protein